MWMQAEEAEVLSLHDVLVIKAKRVVSFAAATATRTPLDLRTELCCLRAAQ